MAETFPHLAPMYRVDGRPMKCSTCPAEAICKETVKPPLAWMLCEAPTEDDVQRWVREGLWWVVRDVRESVARQQAEQKPEERDQ